MGVIIRMFFLVFLLKDYWLFGAGVLLYLFYLILSICIIEGFYTSGVLFISFIGVCLFILSVLVCYYILASRAYLFNGLFFPRRFGLLVFLIIFSIFGVFSIKSFIYFYVFFEGSLLPVFFLLMGWGYNPEKISASLYMLFYTIFGSMPLLLGLFYV
jgi:NADH-ubiquinone oxidoreductase chain 4